MQLMLFFDLVNMAEFEDKECCDTRLSQCVAVVSTSSDNNVKASSVTLQVGIWRKNLCVSWQCVETGLG